MSIDSITFELHDCTIQLVGDDVLIWKGIADHEPDITLGIKELRDALGAASMLVRK